MKLSIVIPIFNEEGIIDDLYQRLVESSPLWEMEYEIVLVDDGSFDNSVEKIKSKVEANDNFKLVKLSRNFGHQAAISAGMKIAQGDVVAIMDGDLQDPPEELKAFLDKWQEGYDVVYAVRTKRKESLLKKLAYKIFYKVLQLISNIEIPLDSGDFCVMDKKVVKALNHEMTEQSRFVRGLRAYAGFRQIGIKYERAARHSGEPKYTFKKLVKLALDGIFDFSTFPLRIATYLGAIIAIPSFLLGFFFIIHRLLDFEIFGYSPTDTPGFATLAVGMFFLNGMVLIIMGIMGEYIGRMYFEVKKRPFYIIDEVVG